MDGAYGPQFKPPPPATGRRPLPYIEEQLRAAVPDLFAGGHRSALYVGANRRRRHFLDDFVAACETVTIVGAFPENGLLGLRTTRRARGVRPCLSGWACAARNPWSELVSRCRGRPIGACTTIMHLGFGPPGGGAGRRRAAAAGGAAGGGTP